jgi:hypothetical protein
MPDGSKGFRAAASNEGQEPIQGEKDANPSVSFQFPLLNGPTATVLDKAGETTASCAGLGGGNDQTPQAAPGNLCIYVTESTNLDVPALAVENDTRLGFGLLAKAKAEGPYFAYGQWAVTAP